METCAYCHQPYSDKAKHYRECTVLLFALTDDWGIKDNGGQSGTRTYADSITLRKMRKPRNRASAKSVPSTHRHAHHNYPARRRAPDEDEGE